MKNFESKLMISKNPEYQIVKYSDSYFQSVKKLFYESHSIKKPNSYFLYNLSSTPYGKPIRFLMKFRNQIVGSHSIRPFKLKIKNREFLGGLTYDTMTAPEHRNKGIFVSLATKTHQEAKKRKYNFVMGFANENSIEGYKKRLGHVELGPINFVRVDKANLGVKKLPKVWDHWFPPNLGKLNNEYKIGKNFPVKIVRDSQFINWRYKKNPNSRYMTCYKSGEYFFVFKKYFNSLHIIDFFGKNNEFYELLLSTAMQIAKNTLCKEVTMWIAEKHPIMKLLGINSMMKVKQQQYLHLIPLNESIAPLLMDFDNWYYTMGDSDVF
jgi:hypothetical protein